MVRLLVDGAFGCGEEVFSLAWLFGGRRVIE